MAPRNVLRCADCGEAGFLSPPQAPSRGPGLHFSGRTNAHRRENRMIARVRSGSIASSLTPRGDVGSPSTSGPGSSRSAPIMVTPRSVSQQSISRLVKRRFASLRPNRWRRHGPRIERCLGLRAVHSRDYHSIVAHGTADEAANPSAPRRRSIAAEPPSGGAAIHHPTG
jgi:hypothetical protein